VNKKLVNTSSLMLLSIELLNIVSIFIITKISSKYKLDMSRMNIDKNLDDTVKWITLTSIDWY